MSLPVATRAVDGVWIRHVPHGAPLLGRASTPADGRWQRGDVVAVLYLADSAETATAEWYRSLAERGFSPQLRTTYPTITTAGDWTFSSLTSATEITSPPSDSTCRGRAGARGQPSNVSANGSGAKAGPA